jgi:hypothetical protein
MGIRAAIPLCAAEYGKFRSGISRDDDGWLASASQPGIRRRRIRTGWSDNRAILSREVGTVKVEREEADTVKAVQEEATRAERVHQAEGRPITRGGTPVTTVEVWSTGSTRWFAPNTTSIWSSWRPSTREPGGSREERREDNKDPT